MRNKERLQENIEKCKAIEASGQENEDARKAGEARSFAAEESLEQMETQLEEANEVAKISNQKFEDASRKLKVVEGDLERVIERAEEFETKGKSKKNKAENLMIVRRSRPLEFYASNLKLHCHENLLL